MKWQRNSTISINELSVNTFENPFQWISTQKALKLGQDCSQGELWYEPKPFLWATLLGWRSQVVDDYLLSTLKNHSNLGRIYSYANGNKQNRSLSPRHVAETAQVSTISSISSREGAASLGQLFSQSVVFINKISSLCA